MIRKIGKARPMSEIDHVIDEKLDIVLVELAATKAASEETRNQTIATRWSVVFVGFSGVAVIIVALAFGLQAFFHHQV